MTRAWPRGSSLRHRKGSSGWRPRQRSKYRNVAVRTTDGFFSSQLEYGRWLVLKCHQVEGKILHLRRQVKYPLVVNGCPVASYVADFVYETPDGQTVVEDVKSSFTAGLALYVLKKRLLKATLGIEIQEIARGGG